MNKTVSRILVVDDHPLIIEGIQNLLCDHKDLTICGTAEDLWSALDKIPELKPDLIIIDISLKGSNDIELLKNVKVRYPKQKVLMLSMHDESLYTVRSLRAGASGYIMKDKAPDELLTAIRQVLNGEVYVSPRMEEKMMQQLTGGRPVRTPSPIEELSDRELEVFGLIGQGHGTRQIAEQLRISLKTVESHRANIKEKLGLKNATELVQHAIQWREC